MEFKITNTFVPLKKPMKIKQIIELSGDSEKVTNYAVCEGKTGFSGPNIKFLFDIVLH